MVRHLHIGPKMSSLEPPEDLSQIWSNSVEKFEPPEQPLLEVRRFFQWCQGMSLGILKRFREKKVQFFFRDFNFGGNIQRLLQKQTTMPHCTHCLQCNCLSFVYRQIFQTFPIYVNHITSPTFSNSFHAKQNKIWVKISKTMASCDLRLGSDPRIQVMTSKSLRCENSQEISDPCSRPALLLPNNLCIKNPK